MTLEELKYKRQLTGGEQLTRDEVEMLMDLEEENHRKGNFERVYPELPLLEPFEKFFEAKRYQNHLVTAYMQAPEKVKAQLIQKLNRQVYKSTV